MSKKNLPYPLTFYDFFYWCRRGGHWIPKENVVEADNGALLCPKHGKRVRTKRIHVNRYKDRRKRVEIEEESLNHE